MTIPSTSASEWGDEIAFVVNGRRFTLTRPSPRMPLIEFLRDVAGLVGTKLGCGEGGCGACTVVLCHRPLDRILLPAPASTATNPDDGVVFRAVNACLFPVCALDGIEVFTVEGIGSMAKGLHPIQARLAAANGTQCGYCTPGWVMNMYELVRTTPPAARSRALIEDHFDGNLCRCTGYRPIFEAFHSFAGPKEPLAIAYEQQEQQEQAEPPPPHQSLLRGCEYEDDWLLVDAEHVPDGRREICEGSCRRAATCSRYLDVEDLLPPRTPLEQLAPETDEIKPSEFVVNFQPRPIKIEVHDGDASVARKWYRPLTLAQLQEIVASNPVGDIMLIGGRTAYGVSKYYNGTAPRNRPTEGMVQVEINYISEMKTLQVRPEERSVVVGAGITIATLHGFLRNFHDEDYDSAVLQELSTLIHRVANNQVRNAGTWAGNLSLCRDHPTFVSDIAVGLMGIGATLTLVNEDFKREENVPVEVFLQRPKSGFELILEMRLPLLMIPSTTSHVTQKFLCYKVAQRPQNSHSHVNSAIFLKLRTDQSPAVCTDVRLAFGGVCGHPSRFTATEKLIKGSAITHENVSTIMQKLEEELQRIGTSSAFGSSTFRVSTMKSLLYKSFVSILRPNLSDDTVSSAPDQLTRHVSSGTQSFKPDASEAPVSNAIPKIGAKMQTAGEARYVADQALPSSTLYGAILFSAKAFATLVSIDPDGSARKEDGVVDILTAADIPGMNDISSGTGEEPLFVPIHGVVRCIGAPLGLVLATTPEIAERVAAVCKIEYGTVEDRDCWPGQKPGTPIVDIDMAVTAGTRAPVDPVRVGDDDVENALKNCKHQLNGTMLLGAQKHFYMEPQISLVSMQEGDVFHVESSTQFPQYIQQQLANVLNVRHNDITVKVQRVGGGFGGKLTRCAVNAAAAAVGAHKYRRSVRVVNDRSSDFRLVGGRENMRGSYRVGFDDDGYISALDLKLDVDCGYLVSDTAGSALMAVMWSDSAYHIKSFRCQAFLYLTNTQNCTSHRAPGVPQSLILLEAALHHVAETLEIPMRWVQERNLYKEGDHTPYKQVLHEVRLQEVWDRLMVSSQIEQKEQSIELYNSNNKWRKRGIAITPTKYAMQSTGRRDGARVEIFAVDGSVIVTHGGCEIGQGIHTKAAQACAYGLKIPMSLISVRPTSTDQTPNSEATGGSSTSESIVRAVLECCKELNASLEEFRRKMKPGDKWRDVVQAAHAAGVRLFAGAQPFSTPSNGDQFDYFVYAAACSEVEVDILTGEINISSSEIVYDCGISLNPAIDIGQIEGGFVMGIGLYLQEEVNHSRSDGDLLNQGTWEYKIPCSKDIPESFKVTLLENAKNSSGVLSSKATGEPPYALASSVYFAVKRAVMDSREERGLTKFVQMDVPATVARRQDLACVANSHYSF